MLKRIYELVMEEHFEQNRQMLFLVGPRQVGKTTASLEVTAAHANHFYFNWDIQTDRLKILEGADAIAHAIQLHHLHSSMPMVVFDELHKYPKWKISRNKKLRHALRRKKLRLLLDQSLKPTLTNFIQLRLSND